MSAESIASPNIGDQVQLEPADQLIIRKTPRHYTIDARVECLEFEEDQLADELENYLIETLIQDIFYTENYVMRVSALHQLNSWIDQRKVKRIFGIIAKNEKDPSLREFASQLLGIN